MQSNDIETVLSSCESELAERGRVDLRAAGFWRAVAAVKRSPELVARYASRIATIDRRAFRAAVPLAFPASAGAALLVAGAGAGLVLLLLAFALPPDPAGLAIVLGMGALDATTHGLAHLLAGTLAGIRFTDWYVDLPKRPQPGFKIDYASYLRASPRARAWMHASGAIVTKIVPFACFPLAYAAHAPWWSGAVLLAFGLVQLATDALFSVRASDWKRFRREMRLADRIPS